MRIMIELEGDSFFYVDHHNVNLAKSVDGEYLLILLGHNIKITEKQFQSIKQEVARLNRLILNEFENLEQIRKLMFKRGSNNSTKL